MSISSTILSAYAKMYQRGWDRIYWAIDIHDTCIESNYSIVEISKNFYPQAKKVLQRLSNRADSVLILFTCSHKTDVDQYLQLFKNNGISFTYINENPEVPNTPLSCFNQKFYTNVYIDDKAGFDPTVDWEVIDDTLTAIDKISEIVCCTSMSHNTFITT